MSSLSASGFWIWVQRSRSVLLVAVLSAVSCTDSAKTCTSSMDCRSDQLCVEQQCLQACNRSTDCATDRRCVNGACQISTSSPDAALTDVHLDDRSGLLDHDLDAGAVDGAPDASARDALFADASALDRALDAALAVDAGWDAGRPPPVDWFHPSWRHRQAIEIDTSWLQETLTDVPLSLRLRRPDLTGLDIDPGGADLRFADLFGALLPYEIERWDPTAESLVWVLLPRVASGQVSHRLWMYFGNAAASDWQSPAEVWRDGFEAVWHLDTRLRDSTGRLPAGQNRGATESSGLLGPSVYLAGDPDHALLGQHAPLIQSASQITLEAWVRYTAGSTGGSNWILSISTSQDPPSTNSRATFAVTDTGQAGIWGRANDSSVYHSLKTRSGVILPERWHQITGSIDLEAGTLAVHVDGQALVRGDYSFSGTRTPADPVTAAVLGSQDNVSSGFFVGDIDELRVSRRLRSDAWILFEYLAATGDITHLGVSESIGHYPRGAPPQAVGDRAETQEDLAVEIAVLDNDVDVDGDSLRVIAISDAALGTVQVLSGGTLRYQPDADVWGDDSFTYVVSDGANGIAVAQVDVAIVPQPDLPRPVDDVVGVVPEGSVDIDLLANDVEVDGETLTIVELSTVPRGALQILNSGLVRYRAGISFVGRTHFTYRVSDSSGQEAQARVDIVVHPSALRLHFAEEGAARGFTHSGGAHGQAWADVDADGWTDVWLGNQGVLLKNNAGVFSSWATLPNNRGGAFADADNDGDLDLMTTNNGGIFYQNIGDSFVDTTDAVGLRGVNVGSVVWLDLDNDGDNDLFFAQGDPPFTDLRRNLGGSAPSFEVVLGADVGLPASIANAETSTSADIDDDGDMDLWVNGYSESYLLLNQGDGRFVDVSATAGLRHVLDSAYAGSAFGDCDNDGDLDLFAARVAGQKNLLYLNDGAGSFSLSTELNQDLGDSRGVAWGDLDLDGWLDLVVANSGTADQVYLGVGACRFVAVGDLIGIDPDGAATTSIRPVDIDNDGDLDLAIARHLQPNALWINQLGASNFLRVIVAGAGPAAGGAARDGIGSRVRVLNLDGALIGRRDVSGGDGFASHDLSPLLFAIPQGRVGQRYFVEVRFTDGELRQRQVVPASVTASRGLQILAQTVEIIQ